MANQAVVAITGNTFPVKDQLKALGAYWNPDQRAWMVRTDQAEATRRIVSGTGATPVQHVSGMANDKQRLALRNLLRRVEHIQMFDSMSGSGAQLADEIREAIQKLGGTQKLTRKQASQFLDTLIGAVEDEM